MDALPSGTVTFLLTDVEGSTALWEQSPEAMRPALARHDDLFERAVHAHDGFHIRPRGEGDSRFAVFVSAPDAVAAASAIQHAFSVEPWPTPRPIRVRIGIHTGEAQLREGDYYGSAVNRCARIRSLSHGGQILLSEATAALVRDELARSFTLLDLGEHHLKGLTRPERVFQISVPGLPTSFPPLVSEDIRLPHLMTQTTTLIGRERELSQIHALLAGDAVRLLNLTGPGGVGKTALALHVASALTDRFADGVYVVDLAPLTDPALVTSTISSALGATSSGAEPQEELRRFLQGRTVLLVLDNFEQILPAASVVGALLRAAPQLKVLVTSRAALQIRGEHELPIAPLDVPDPARSISPAALRDNPAVALFVARAQAIRPDLELTAENASDIATICARLDGLPLALELAAARSRLLPPAAMVRRLEQRLSLLSSGPRDLPVRQQALRDTIAWSFDLLEPAEQRAFRALSVFVGGFTLDAAERVARSEAPAVGRGPAPSLLAQDDSILDVVERLVAQSLVRADPDDRGDPRFRMLETIREFGLEMLEASGEVSTVRTRHLAWCLDLATEANEYVGKPGQPAWLERLDAEHDNLRAALRWSAEPSVDPELGLRLVSALHVFWSLRGHPREGRAWVARLLARSSARTLGRSMALRCAGYLALRQNDHTEAAAALEEARGIASELSDRSGLAMILRHLGLVAHHLREYDHARELLEESAGMARELGQQQDTTITLRHLADLAFEQGRNAEAAAGYGECLVLARELGNTHETAYAQRGLGSIARAQGDYPRARELLRGSVRLLASLGDRRCTPICLEGLACTEVEANWAERAVRMFAAARALHEATGALASPAEMADHRRTEADARAQLGEARFAAVWAAGAAMSLDEVVAYALADDESAEAIAGGHAATVASHDGQGGATGALHPGAAQSGRHPEHHIRAPLSTREREVVALIAGGLSNREIAERLVLSVRTVERHIENVYNRLGISGKAGRAIVTAYALRHRLMELT